MYNTIEKKDDKIHKMIISRIFSNQFYTQSCHESAEKKEICQMSIIHTTLLALPHNVFITCLFHTPIYTV